MKLLYNLGLKSNLLLSIRNANETGIIIKWLTDVGKRQGSQKKNVAGKIDTIIVGDFNKPLSTINITTREKSQCEYR